MRNKLTDTLFADVSYFQRPVNDDYPHQFISFRANDGTFRDPNFDLNLGWAAGALRRGRIVGFAVYFVYEDNASDTVATLQALLAAPRPWWTRGKFNKMAVVLDVESWGGRMSGDHSASVRHVREQVIRTLNDHRRPWRRKRHYERDRKRVVVYGNAGDLGSMAPSIGDAQVVLANYGDNPAYPGKVAHQFSDHYPCAPFGFCDMNSADGVSPDEFAVLLGLRRPPRARKHRRGSK